MTLSYSIDEACKITGIGRTKLYEAINKGELTAKKYGKRTVILKSDIELFLNGLSDYRTPSQKRKISRIKKKGD